MHPDAVEFAQERLDEQARIAAQAKIFSDECASSGDSGLRHLALDAAIKVHGDCGDFGEILVAAAAYEAYLRTGAVPTEDEDE